MAGVRWVVAGSLLIAFFRIRGDPFPERRQWVSLVVRGALLIGLGNGAVVWAEQTVPSGLAAVLVAAVPFWMVGIDALAGDGKAPNVRQIVGLFVGFSGVVLLVSPNTRMVAGSGFWSGFIATQLACAGWSLGSTYARRAEQHTLPDVAFEMLFGGILLLVAAAMLGEKVGGIITSRSAGALVYLIVFGSLIAFSCYRYALQHLPVAILSLYVYANTVIAVLLGTLLVGEPFSFWMGTGAAVVLVAIGMVRKQDG
jgi:drug/metabolite transporter (DMT)-like permease